jgi:hypothetical protein
MRVALGVSHGGAEAGWRRMFVPGAGRKLSASRMTRRVGYGIAAVAGTVAAYYAIPLFVGVISLGEICPYSPSGTSLCAGRSAAPPVGALQLPSGVVTDPGRIGAKLCSEPGLRYSGATSEGAKVCFTLTPNRRNWLEIGFMFIRASGCPQYAGTGSTTGEKQYKGPEPLTDSGRITVPGFTAAIRGARASGVLRDSEICGDKTFKWNARRAP